MYICSNHAQLLGGSGWNHCSRTWRCLCGRVTKINLFEETSNTWCWVPRWRWIVKRLGVSCRRPQHQNRRIQLARSAFSHMQPCLLSIREMLLSIEDRVYHALTCMILLWDLRDRIPTAEKRYRRRPTCMPMRVESSCPIKRINWPSRGNLRSHYYLPTSGGEKPGANSFKSLHGTTAMGRCRFQW